MSEVESKKDTTQTPSFTTLVRVLLVFPLIIILGSLAGKKIVEIFELAEPVYFLAFVGLSTVLGWAYVGYEYKRARAVLQIKDQSRD